MEAGPHHHHPLPGSAKRKHWFKCSAATCFWQPMAPKRKKGFPWCGPSSWYRRPGGLGCIYTRVCVCVCVRVIDTVKKEKPRSFRFKGSFLDSCLRRFFRPPWPLKALFAAACCHRSRSGPWKTKEMLRDGARRRERSHPALSVKI